MQVNPSVLYLACHSIDNILGNSRQVDALAAGSEPSLIKSIAVQEVRRKVNQLGRVALRNPQKAVSVPTREILKVRARHLNSAGHCAKQSANVMREHADQLLTVLIGSAQVGVDSAKLVLELFRSQRSADSCHQLFGYERLHQI